MEANKFNTHKKFLGPNWESNTLPSRNCWPAIEMPHMLSTVVSRVGHTLLGQEMTWGRGCWILEVTTVPGYHTTQTHFQQMLHLSLEISLCLPDFGQHLTVCPSLCLNPCPPGFSLQLPDSSQALFSIKGIWT